ncbi:hypothetical protein HM1_1151 [Heliomicrobium modesticaldum Ice1]|uniref:Glycosyltransferase subfamily 4-like N-terminal domain-containing protein n=1 Tax=Heliobacterium modesticaldum (strain ATCC 51547 / Ice1) TaxID=498761 RepID=B0THI5_HELMI|nr:hypothetical protein [Heliomicrobium modesticaldum]ABZ83423.1 hypothetical protein HM1_1151 [Heliomicrobium modesticaldum Ice1]
MKIVGVSDVSIGYGSPQVPAFIQSIYNYYVNVGILATGYILEPDQPESPPVHDHFEDLVINRVYTQYHPHTSQGRLEYINKAAQLVNRLQPDILIVFCTYSLPILYKLKRKPKFTIYYNYEMVHLYGIFELEMNRHFEGIIDLVVYPEENRAVKDIEHCGFKKIPSEILYNIAMSKDNFSIRNVDERNGRILYQGTIDFVKTFGNYYLDSRIQKINIDLYGKISGDNSDFLFQSLTESTGAIRYMGYVDNKRLSQIRKHYSYSIVSWNPINESYLFACPNKFFESIFDGVPPLSAPHPQCKSIITQYECGLLMEDWSLKSFLTTLMTANRLLGTTKYAKMVENCKIAAVNELNWDNQFKKVEPYLIKLRKV